MVDSDASISVVIPVRNGERFLAEALESVLGQTAAPAEVIVVDDGSTDRTAEVARGFPVRLLGQEPLGVSAARNAGLAAAAGDLVTFLDHDDLWEPATLELQRQALAGGPERAYSVGRTAPFVEPGTPHPAWVTDDLARDGFYGVAVGASMAPRGLFDEIGGFDPSLAVGEDADWFIRVQDAGVLRVSVDEVVLRYRMHGHNTTAGGHVAPSAVIQVLRMAVARRRGEDPRGVG